MINGKEIGEYISRSDLFDVVYTPLKVTKLKEKFYFEVKVAGSGESAQAQAIRHGLARALVAKDEALRPVLKEA
jgi:small subunit ribosomal protein S9